MTEKLLREWSAGGIANALTSGLLNPMDVAKTRLQIENANSSKSLSGSSGISLVRTLVTLHREGGIVGLWYAE